GPNRRTGRQPREDHIPTVVETDVVQSSFEGAATRCRRARFQHRTEHPALVGIAVDAARKTCQVGRFKAETCPHVTTIVQRKSSQLALTESERRAARGREPRPDKLRYAATLIDEDTLVRIRLSVGGESHSSGIIDCRRLEVGCEVSSARRWLA